MRLAVSNIAWPAEADELVAAILRGHGVQGVEIAPTKTWPQPLEASPASVRAYRETWEERGLPIVSMQALLYGRPELTIFDDVATRRRTRDYLAGIIELAAELGAKALVFGSPKSRRRGSLTPEKADEIAIPFFREMGRIAAERGIDFCLEPNPVDYGCDYATRAAEGLDLVCRADQEGFGLHLDAAAMMLAGDAPAESIARAGTRLRHFHASEPFLAPIGSAVVDHQLFAQALRACRYDRWVSIEMKQADGDWLGALVRAVSIVQEHYGAAAIAAKGRRVSPEAA